MKNKQDPVLKYIVFTGEKKIPREELEDNHLQLKTVIILKKGN